MKTVPFDADNAPLDALADIHASCFFEPWDKDTFEAFLTTFGTKGICLISHGAVVGFVFYRQAFSDAEILTICVLPEYQNQGCGKKLIAAMLQIIEKPGKCFLEVSNINTAAIHLYEKMGFNIVHTRVNYYGPGLDAYMMMIELSA